MLMMNSYWEKIYCTEKKKTDLTEPLYRLSGINCGENEVYVLVSSLEVRTILNSVKITKKPFKIGEAPTFRNDKIDQNYIR